MGMAIGFSRGNLKIQHFSLALNKNHWWKIGGKNIFELFVQNQVFWCIWLVWRKNYLSLLVLQVQRHLLILVKLSLILTNFSTSKEISVKHYHSFECKHLGRLILKWLENVCWNQQFQNVTEVVATYTRSLHNAIFGTRKTAHYARTALTKTNFTSANFRATENLCHYKRV